MNVTDGLVDTCWKPGIEVEGQWVMVDLEGLKKAEQAVITFAGTDTPPNLELLYSLDGKIFYPLEAIKSGESNIIIVNELPSDGLRYLKVIFPTVESAAIKQIEMNT